MVDVHESRRVAAWNIFLDDHYPQEERLESIAGTLRDQGEFDLVGILEAQGQNGRLLAKDISDTNGKWYPHSRADKEEYIGVFGPEIWSAEPVELGHHKTAVVTRLGDVAIAVVHLRKQPKYIPPTSEQVEQTMILLEYLSDEEKAIIMGDLNCLRFQMPRLMIKKAGFDPAVKQAGVKRERTVPADEQFTEYYRWRRKLGLKLAGGAINVDDVYTRGVEVIDAGYFNGASDHKGVWAEYKE